MTLYCCWSLRRERNGISHFVVDVVSSDFNQVLFQRNLSSSCSLVAHLIVTWTWLVSIEIRSFSLVDSYTHSMKLKWWRNRWKNTFLAPAKFRLSGSSSFSLIDHIVSMGKKTLSMTLHTVSRRPTTVFFKCNEIIQPIVKLHTKKKVSNNKHDHRRQRWSNKILKPTSWNRRTK